MKTTLNKPQWIDVLEIDKYQQNFLFYVENDVSPKWIL